MNARSTRRQFLRRGAAAAAAAGAAATLGKVSLEAKPVSEKRPNILFAIADDWSWPHASCAGDPVVRTPTFDRLVREGVLFTRSHCIAPSCSPSRASVLTGQQFYRLEEAANLWSTVPAKFAVYPDLLEQAGYAVGCWGKGWGPGDAEAGGRERNAAGPRVKDFGAWLAKLPADQPFCFWFGSKHPHRGYKKGSGRARGLKIEDVKVPPFLPDSDEVRDDLLDYYAEVEDFDTQVAGLLEALEKAGRLDETLLVMTSDNGLPFPRAKTTLYDSGTHMPLVVRWGKAKPGRTVEDLTSFDDFAPTFLEAAGVPVPAEMTGRSLLPILAGTGEGQVDPERDFVVVGRERHHGKAREGCLGYPSRALRTREFLYIRNFEPDRWPAGDPPTDPDWSGEETVGGYADIDGGPTKRYLMAHRDDAAVRPIFDRACAKRPAEELYDLAKDPYELTSVAADPAYAEARERMAARLTEFLRATGDPRVVGGAKFDEYPYRT